MINWADKRLAVAGVAVILVGSGVFFYQKSKSADNLTVQPEITLEPNEQMSEVLPEPMSEEEKQAIEDKFAREGAEMTLLKNVNNGQAVGTAWRNFDGLKFYHKVDASGLSAIEKGYFYEGWLVTDNGFFSTGRMAIINSQGQLYYISDSDKSNYRGIVITLEAEDGNPAPDKHILEGSF